MTAPSPEELLGFLRRVIEKEFEIPASEVEPEAHLQDDLGLDSLDAVVLALRIEEELHLELTDDEIKGLDRVASLVALAHRRLVGQSGESS